MKFLPSLLFLYLLTITNAYGQKAIKLQKQKTTFFYTQFNFHYGYIDNGIAPSWDLSEMGSKNQVAFQLFSKNQRLMQKGYTKLIASDSWKIRFSLAYNDYLAVDGFNHGDLRLNLLDSWVKFRTKWDRTTVTIGKKTLPYGHNPKIDPASNFMTNIIGSDLGFSQDFGIFVKTPISRALDAEFAITSGGLLNGPIAICRDLLMDEELMGETCRLDFESIKYNNTWLLTGRIGQQSFRKNEFGLLAATGYIPNVFDRNTLNYVTRIGADWVYKHKEILKIVNQVAVGRNELDSNNDNISLAVQNNIDLFLKSKFVISAGHSYVVQDPIESGEENQKRSTFTNSVSYSFSPHTRVRLNHYHVYTKNSNDNWGVLLQLVTGFGKRP